MALMRCRVPGMPAQGGTARPEHGDAAEHLMLQS
jgi:hypothetical protein